jgi:hypothetical protein
MTTHRPDRDAEQAAGDRLRKRLAAVPAYHALTAMPGVVASYATLGPDNLPGILPAPLAASAGDITDALTLVVSARYQLEEDEMRLIAHGLARGMSWDQLGGNAIRARYGRLRESHPGWGAPHRNAARWAVVNPVRLRAAVDRVLAHRAAIAASGMLAAAAVTAEDLATVLETSPAPKALYWAAYGAVASGLRSDSMSTPAGQALIALRKLVTAPN